MCNRPPAASDTLCTGAKTLRRTLKPVMHKFLWVDRLVKARAKLISQELEPDASVGRSLFCLAFAAKSD